jgi:hypothetical protein
VLNSVVADKKSPIIYGYGDNLAIYFNQAPVLQVSATGGLGFGGGGGGQFGDAPVGRPTGRGTLSDPDIPQGREFVAPPERPQVRPGEEPPLDDEQREALRGFLPGPDSRPRVVLRFSDEKDLMISGMLAGGREVANRPAWWMCRGARVTCCCLRTIRFGAMPRRAATFCCSTRC